ncbi:MAG: phospholipase [Acetobacteraceae bacterium]|nr:phospholipase [Acetobacteraceae bacterium]
MARIEHIVVLMLENRPFDCMLGRLYPDCPDFDGLRGDEANPLTLPDGSHQMIRVWNEPQITPENACIPDPDPGELFDDITMQIFGLGKGPADPPTMSGFVDNYVRQPDGGSRDPRAVMHYFTPDQVPVISALARAFGVCDRWFGAAPCQTWPNRLFAHTGAAGGRVNNEAIPLPFFLRTVFTRLGRCGRSWKVYFHDLPQTAALLDLWPRLLTNFLLFEPDFIGDARNGTLPNYSFIEPRYFPSILSGAPPNDEHPPHNVMYGEQLIASVYNAIRGGAGWTRTLLLITYDEHGGCYDHVPPPPAVPPGPPYSDGFTFDRYGVRVPAVVVSPWIPAGSVIRPPPGGAPFDHTSILATLHKLFEIGPPPTARVAAAPDLLMALTLDRPDNSGPQCLDVSETSADREEIRALLRLERNGHQRRLRHPFARIPGAMARAAGHFHTHRRRKLTESAE